MKRIIAMLTALLALMPVGLAEISMSGETDGDVIYTMYDQDGTRITSRAGKMYYGDEYISGDDQLYRVVEVNEEEMIAVAEHLGEAQIDVEAFSGFMSAVAEDKKLICMYSTHSDESYVPNDGDYSLEEDAGIYDVGEALKDNLEAHGIEVVYSQDTFLPHDAGAYSRSRSTAEELLKKGPDALFDIHRDGVAADEYETEVDGEEASKVRLFVGRSNQNSAENKAFAQKIKATADEEYPGLIKDIYIGKGNYNQELYGHALLLELGTHEIDKDLAITSTDYLADVINQVVYPESGAEATVQKEEGMSGVTKGIIWVIVVAVIGAAIYGLAATGKLSGMWDKIKRGTSELTAGAAGKKPHKK